MSYKLVIYDWNGTLLKDTHLGRPCLISVFEKLAPGVSIPDFETYRDQVVQSEWAEFFYQHGISKKVGINEMLDVWFGRYRALSSIENSHLNDGVRELLMFCKESGISNAIVTASRDSIRPYLEKLGIESLFASVKNNTMNGWTKEGAIKKMLGEFNIDSREACYIDDTFDGIIHGNLAGVATIGFTGGLHTEKNIRAANPRHVIHSLHAVADILRAEN